MRRSPSPRWFAGGLALAVLAALPLSAQQHAHPGGMQERGSGMPHMQMMQGMMQGGGMGMMGMMEGMHPGPGMILGAAGQLGLTPDQEERLRALQDELQGMQQAHMQAAMAARRAAVGALEGEAPDLERFEQQLDAAAEQMVAMQVAVARSGLAAREILLPAQREQLDGVLSMMRHMQGRGMGMMQGMGPGGGMGPGR